MKNLTKSDISLLRLQNQKLDGTKFRKAEDVVAWMGAMQAQDFPMAEWAVGTRILDPSAGKIETAVNKAAIIRTHLMRPTWHFVAAGDVYWLLELTAPRIRSSLKSRQKFLGLPEDLIIKCNRMLTWELERTGALTREELVTLFANAGIRTDENRFSHLMVCAELDAIVCSGPMKNGKQTYALLQERVPTVRRLSREESLAELAKRYFTSHGPATAKDFAWWSGLSSADIRKAIESNRGYLDSETVGNERYWFKGSHSTPVLNKNSVLLLPAYDEFLIAYSDRSASLARTDHKMTVSNNGIFRPVIVVNGQVAGLWKRMKTKNKVVLELSFFLPANKIIRSLAEQAALHYEKFLGVSTEVKITG